MRIDDDSPDCQMLLKRKAGLCSSMLAQLHRMSQVGIYGPMYDHLLSRTSEILDEMDEIQLQDPVGAGDTCSRIASLRNQLNALQSTVLRQEIT